jgi:hypothetical protein
MDETLLKYKLDTSKKKINREVRPRQSNLTQPDEDDENRPKIEDIILNADDNDAVESIKLSDGGKVMVDKVDGRADEEDVGKITKVTDSIESSSYRPLEYDITTIRTCIDKIHNLNNK